LRKRRQHDFREVSDILASPLGIGHEIVPQPEAITVFTACDENEKTEEKQAKSKPRHHEKRMKVRRTIRLQRDAKGGA
jgi:hypothetical protein